MKFAKCDKCGKTMSITLVDSDYLVVVDGKTIYGDDTETEIISEVEIAGKTLDLCTTCYKELTKKKMLLDEEFIKQCALTQEGSENESDFTKRATPVG